MSGLCGLGLWVYEVAVTTLRSGDLMGMFLPMSLGLFVVASLMVSGLYGATRRIVEPRGARAAIVGGGAGLGGVNLVILEVWNLPYALPLVGLSVVFSILAIAVLYRAPLAVRRWLVGGGIGLALYLDATVFHGLYLTFHDLLVFWVLLGSVFLASQLPWERVGLGLSAIGLMCSLAWNLDVKAGLFYSELNGQIMPALRRIAQRAIDLDADGYAAILAGPDCNDFDSAVYPGACEVPGDGVDRNCNGMDGLPARGEGLDAPADLSGPKRFDAPPDIVFVMFDTFRGDFAGRGLPSLKAFHELDQQSVSFPNAYTAFPVTQLALRAIFRSSPAHSLRQGPHMVGILEKHGYRARVFANTRIYPLDANADSYPYLNFDHTATKATASQSTLDVFRRASMGKAPEFQWVHFYDLHAPLMTEGDSPIDKYRAALSVADEILEGVMAIVRQRQRPAIVIVTGDHGEEFGEHGGTDHARALYEESVRVPLWIRVPGLSPQRIDRPVSLTDIAPTLVNMLGYERPAEWSGRDLFIERDGPRYLSDAYGFETAAALNLPLGHMARDGRYKLIANIERNYNELYDLVNDPEEKKPLPPWEYGEVIERLEREILIAKERDVCVPE